jgi:quercetin dioxygenase-like cupin family protein
MNNVIKCDCKLADVLRAAIPVDGYDFKNMIQVHLKKGESVRSHYHTDHTALYYPADCEPIRITPTAGMIIYLPPGTQHAVPKVTKERVSVAMLVDPERPEEAL